MSSGRDGAGLSSFYLLWDAYMKRFEVAVLITNDSDLAEPVRIVALEIGRQLGS